MAERKIAAFFEEDYPPEKDSWPISFVKITLTDKSVRSHRDFLGSILGLGIKRDCIGDIIISENTVLVAAEPKIAAFIKENLVFVSHSKCECEIINISEFEIPEKLFENIRLTLSSLRLDCVIAGICGKSRTTAAELISSGKVQINYEEVTSVSHKIFTGDIICVRGNGKFIFDGENGLSKKGKVISLFKKYI